MTLTDVERAILNRIQSNFPITERPFERIGQELDIPEQTVLAIVRRLKEKGIVRRIGGNVAPKKIGFVSTLCAARVPEDKMEVFTQAVNRRAGVTHNYVRGHDYNVWFTFIAPSMEAIETHLEDIQEETGIEKILNMPATHVFKIKAEFEV